MVNTGPYQEKRYKIALLFVVCHRLISKSLYESYRIKYKCLTGKLIFEGNFSNKNESFFSCYV